MLNNGYRTEKNCHFMNESKITVKKALKNLLVGAGLAVAGLIVYSAWKDAEEPVAVQSTDGNTVPTTPSKEYVEHRRQQIREAAEARRVAQEKTVEPLSEESPQDGEKPEAHGTTLENPGAVPVEPAPLEQTGD